MGTTSRRVFLSQSARLAGGFGLIGLAGEPLPAAPDEPLFGISLAEWSLHRALFSGRLDHLDFATTARDQLGIEAVEYVNQFFFDKSDRAYVREMKRRADGEGVQSLLIMCDREGRLGDPDEKARLRTVENHLKWLDAARDLGCHSIRVNARSAGSPEEQAKLVADGLRRLVEHGDQRGVNVLVENHGGLSSNGQWLGGVIRAVDHPRCGTLPDFGNFGDQRQPGVNEEEPYDPYRGVKELMPWAKAVSAKTHSFDDEGNETDIDYRRMMKIVLDAGYRGYVGIEYEGSQLSEQEGIKATKRLLERLQEEMAEAYHQDAI
jgi:L-ribulose-5-phosphate 3-epimerase